MSSVQGLLVDIRPFPTPLVLLKLSASTSGAVGKKAPWWEDKSSRGLLFLQNKTVKRSFGKKI